jgi:alcohol dehydrogenase class IV
MGLNIVGGIGLSHSLGYALGSPYGIPHGITSCLTLGKVVKLKAEDPEAAEQIARILPFIGKNSSGDNKKDAESGQYFAKCHSFSMGLREVARQVHFRKLVEVQ